MPATMSGTLGVGIVVTIALAPVSSPTALAAWFGVLSAVLAGRAWLWWIWRKEPDAPPARQRTWLVRFRVSVACTGITLGASAFVVFPADDTARLAIYVFALAGVCASATNTLSADRVAAAALIVPTLLPILVRLFAEGTPDARFLGTLLCLYPPYAAVAVERNYRRIRENFELREQAEARARELEESARNLRESQSHLSGVNANMVGMAIYRLSYSPEGRMSCTYVSPSVEDLLGVPAETLRADPERVFALIEPRAVPTVRASIAENLRSGGIGSIEVPVRLPHGQRRWIKFHSHLATRLPDGTQIRDGIAIDTTARRETEAELENHRQRLDLALDAGNTCTWDNDLETGRITLDARWAAMLGHPPHETTTTARGLLSLVHPDDRPEVFASAARIADPAHDDYLIEQRVRNAQGDWIWISSRGRVVRRRPDGRPARVIGVNTDITAYKTAGELLAQRVAERTAALAESERRHRTLLDNLQGMAYRCRADDAWTMEFASEGSLALVGYAPTDLVGGSVAYGDRVHPEDADRVWESFQTALAARIPCQVQYRVRHADGTWRWVWEQGRGIYDESGCPVAIEGYITDVTERVRLEQQRNRAQRLESIGTLAGGIAHDLNNALAPILAGVGLLSRRDPEEDEILDTIDESARRGAAMVKRLLTFARGDEGQRITLQPASLLRDMERIMRSTFPKNIDIRVEVAPETPSVVGDPTQLHQVILNLCVNARDAMPHGGRVTLACFRREDTPPEARADASPSSAGWVVLRVSDSGPGIPSEILDRIFDPFFTTKPPDKGSGLGLSTVLGITRAHGGFVDVSTEPGQGAVFSVHLPALTEASSAVAGVQRPRDASGHGETILFVDDEAAVRTIVARVLERLGYTPLVAAGAHEALALLDAHRAQVSALVTDLNMPQIDGLALVRIVRARTKELPVVVASGHLDDAAQTALAALGVRHTLAKPFTPDLLAETLRCALGTRDVSASPPPADAHA
jgi:PAS domain S-box-containing protein